MLSSSLLLPLPHSLQVHRIFGCVLVAMMAVHMFLWWKVFADLGRFPGAMFGFPKDYPADSSQALVQGNWTVSMIFVVSVLFFFGMIGTLSIVKV
jgi:succinate dehydrogenase/fumarate reductase cytochrome b subunit